MNIEKLKDKIKETLYKNPLDYEDEDNLYSSNWELVNPRSRGKYAGSRQIGFANIMLCENIINREYLRKEEFLEDENEQEETCLVILNHILEDLTKERVIRKLPETTRKNFKVV